MTMVVAAMLECYLTVVKDVAEGLSLTTLPTTVIQASP